MSRPTSQRFKYPLISLAASIATFFSGTLFFLPGVCGGPGLLGFDSEPAGYLGLALYLAGAAGFVISFVWLIAVLSLRGAKAVDPTPQNP